MRLHDYIANLQRDKEKLEETKKALNKDLREYRGKVLILETQEQILERNFQESEKMWRFLYEGDGELRKEISTLGDQKRDLEHEIWSLNLRLSAAAREKQTLESGYKRELQLLKSKHEDEMRRAAANYNVVS